MIFSAQMRPIRFIKFFFICACLLLSSKLTADVLLDEKVKTGSISLANEISYLEDVDGSLEYSDVSTMGQAFTALRDSSINFGYTKSTYWIRTVVKSTSQDSSQWLLEIAYPLLDEIIVYERDQYGKVIIHQAGDHQIFAEREVENKNFLFELSLSQNVSTELLIRVKSSSSMQIPIKLWSSDSYTASSHVEHFMLGLYYGTLLALFAYNLMLIFWIKDTVYIYYAGYLAFYSVFQLSINGLAYKYIWPESIWLADRGVLVFLCLAVIFATKFSHSLLQVKSFSLALDKVYLFVIGFFISMIPLSLVVDYQAMIQLLSTTTLVAGCLFFFASYRSLQSGISTAKYYLFALFVLLIGMVLYFLKSQGLTPALSLFEYTIMVASTSEAILLSFALSHRFKMLKDENTHMQKEAQETLEQSVAERTKELESVLDELSIANTRLEGLNNTDTLTGVRSRAYFDEHAEFVWNKTDRANEELAIMMLDVDNFKIINDNYGHLIGDEVLVSVAQAINSSLTRSTDQMARYGGEEFIVILPASILEGVVGIAEKIRESVEKLDTGNLGLSQIVTISIGVTMERPSIGDSTLRDAIERADKALYQAKNSGKNCVVIYDWETQNNAVAEPPGASSLDRRA